MRGAISRSLGANQFRPIELDPIKDLLRPRTWDDVWNQYVNEEVERGADPDQFLQFN
jgi:hypothetical protein